MTKKSYVVFLWEFSELNEIHSKKINENVATDARQTENNVFKETLTSLLLCGTANTWGLVLEESLCIKHMRLLAVAAMWKLINQV